MHLSENGVFLSLFAVNIDDINDIFILCVNDRLID